MVGPIPSKAEASGARSGSLEATDWAEAEQIAFRAFANCYSREIDGGRIVRGNPTGVSAIEWQLPSVGRIVRAGIAYRSLCGAHRFSDVQGVAEDGLGFRPIDRLTAIQWMITEAGRRTDGGAVDTLKSAELFMQVIASTRAVALNIARLTTPAVAHPSVPSFVETEQSVLGGHWLHPTPKSMDGIAGWQREVYGPETGRSFRLAAFAVRQDLVRESAAYGPLPSALAVAIAGETFARERLRDDEALLLMHPLQAQHLLLTPAVEAMGEDGLLRPLGESGPCFYATSSMRTVYAPHASHMLKFSLPVQITNSVRRNRIEEMKAGAAMAAWLSLTGRAGPREPLTILPDPAWITVTMPGFSESGFETIYRQTIGPDSHGDYPTMIAALVACAPRGGDSLLKRWIARLAGGAGHAELARTAAAWFEAYLAASLDPVVFFFDRTGIALEAHQQNALLKSHRGWPSGLLYRDNQGFYLSRERRGEITADFPEAIGIDGLFFDEAEIVGRMSYYLLVNQVFAVVACLGEDGLMAEEQGLARLRARLEGLHSQTKSSGRHFCELVLDAPELVLKANLGLRLAAIDELATGHGAGVYTRIANPVAHIGIPNARLAS
ncbi:IucA/IucC [Fulvimarina pelagi HTCC2506]|uniref:IucA/IucC n=2 Tax=Fulvimarina pelagi TaxID=217511 RepID=Q0G364_9HYPH|nr:IucA/IucC [Fulvimarina pelagi HTCC2506]